MGISLFKKELEGLCNASHHHILGCRRRVRQVLRAHRLQGKQLSWRWLLLTFSNFICSNAHPSGNGSRTPELVNCTAQHSNLLHFGDESESKPTRSSALQAVWPVAVACYVSDAVGHGTDNATCRQDPKEVILQLREKRKAAAKSILALQSMNRSPHILGQGTAF